MPSLKDIRKRIGSVKNTQKITRAMKLVAAAKLRRAQDAIIAARPYADGIEQVVVIYAGTNGFIDDYPVSALHRYEKELLEFVRSRKKDLLDGLRTSGKLDDGIEKSMRDALTEFAKTFSVSE